MSNYLEWAQAFGGRLTRADAGAYMKKAPEVAARLKKECAEGVLPFLTMPYKAALERDLPPVIGRIGRFRHMLLLGIGGSALGARAMQKAFAPGQDGPDYHGPCLWIADNVCAEAFDGLLEKLDPRETVVVCVSKSGGTIETLAQYFLVRQWLQKAIGDEWVNQLVVVTDREKGFLRQEATQYGLSSLEVPDYLGGRYSALSAVGLLPAAFLGMDWRGLLAGAESVAREILSAEDLGKNPSFCLAAWAAALMDRNYSELIFFCYIPQWSTYGPWFAQLWAESLGKQGKGSMPIPATGVTDQHSVNQMFLDGPRNKGCIFLTGDQPAGRSAFGADLPEKWSWLAGKPFGALLEAEALGTRMALCQSGVPLLGLHMGRLDEFGGGAMMLMLEAATIFTGWLMGINPVDQPAVELGKRLANSRLGAAGYEREAADLAAFIAAPADRQAF